MTKLEKITLGTQLALLQAAKQTRQVKAQIRKVKKMIEWGEAYDPDTDWWPNKYPDM